LYRTAGFAALGVGAASLALALVSGIITASTDGHLEGVCDAEGVCPPDEAGAVNRRNSAARATNIGLVTGTVAAALGLSLVLLTQEDSADVAMSIRATSTSLHLRGNF
jgi:hypothetical protein